MDPQALDLATKTLAAAIDSLMAKGSPFIPIVVIEKDGRREVRHATAGKGEDPAAVAKQLAAGEAGADATAYAVDGSIQFDGAGHEGIIVEAWNFRTSRGARVGLRYELRGVMRKKPSLIGSPLHRGRDGWYDPEGGEPPKRPEAVPTFPEAVLTAPEPPAAASAPVVEPEPPAVHDLDPGSGFGPPPAAEELAPADVAPPPPPSTRGSPSVPLVEPPELPALPQAFSAPPPVGIGPPPPSPGFGAPPVLSDFGPPPTTAPVPGAPPESARPLPVPPVPAAEQPTAVPGYAQVPIQRNETPLGNRAMFAGIMELATKGRSFPAFAIVQKGGAWEQVTMTDASLEEAAASVRAYARTRTDADFIALALDGFVTVEGAPVSAVIVEVWEYATRVSFSVAQRYVPTGDPPSPRLSGRPLMRTQSGWVDVPSSMTLGGQVQFGYRDPDPA